MEENGWTKVQTDVWNPEEGNAIVGVYIGKQTDVGENKSNLYTIEVEGGQQFGVWGSKVIDGKMLSINPGDQVKIVYHGKVKPEGGGKEYKSYDVFIKKTV